MAVPIVSTAGTRLETALTGATQDVDGDQQVLWCTGVGSSRHEQDPHRRPRLPLQPTLRCAGRPRRSVEWLCFPRFDSPSVFARLLDDDAGHWQIRPGGEWQASRRYVERSLVLETTFRSTAGEVVLTDALPAGPGNRRAPPGGEPPPPR